MARIIPLEELLTTHGCGFIERIWLEKNQTIEEAEHDVSPVVWIGEHYYESDMSGYLDYCDGVFDKPSDEEYNELDPEDYQKLICGLRIWDHEPTDEQMKNTPWKEKKQ